MRDPYLYGLVIALFLIDRYFTHKEKQIIMAQIDDLNAAIDAISTKVGKVGDELKTVIAELAEANQNPDVDLTVSIAKLQGISDSLDSLDVLVPDVPATPEEPAV